MSPPGAGVRGAAASDNLGAHMSIAGGLPNAVRRGVAAGCGVVQIFVNIRTPRRFAAVLAELDRAVGLGRLAAFHLNDSKAGLGSKLDRHENIGAGHIGLAAFRFLLDHPRLGMLPMLLETPKRDDGDLRNLATLRGLRRGSGPRR